MTKVYVSAGSGIVGYGIMKCLRSGASDVHIVTSSVHEASVAPKYADIFQVAPMTTDESYLPWLMSLIRSHSIDIIIPGIEADLYSWTDSADVLAELSTKSVLNNATLVNLCRDKWTFFQYISQFNLCSTISTSIPTNYQSLSSAFGDRMVLKPRRGFGSKGVCKVTSKREFDQCMEMATSPLIVQPYIGDDGHEYTVSVFGDGLGNFTAGIALRRQLSLEGFTSMAEVVPMTMFEVPVRELCKVLNPIGPTNFQFRIGGAGPMLLEVNPRISSSTSLRAAFGYNEAKMCIDYYLHNQLPSQPLIRSGRAIRYSEDYVTYDDSIHI